MMEQQLSFFRLWNLIRSELPTKQQWYLLAVCLGITAVTFSAVSLQDLYYGSIDISPYNELFGYGLFIWGLLLTSLAFQDLNDRTQCEAYLLLPASILEKFLATQIRLVAILGTILCVFVLVISAVVEWLGFAFFGIRRSLFNPFDFDVLQIFGYYILIQSIFVLGAIWFRRLALLKLILTLIVLIYGFAMVILITFSFAIGDFYWNYWTGPTSYDKIIDSAYLVFNELFERLQSQHFETQVAIIYKVLFILPPVLWCVAWLRLREVQVSDGV